ncbi:hypothetical protein Psta_1883 [Pirellula staleyi DSM 6068]|uniref:Uncharacterized protein n=1 Tax=Pirellula staleyi (strain ATCC 27377 / DSM 6068 / ICPB 4128) TaxID=530564 RepID=D2QZS4_PIRSD|nr:hypothetical protein [Pirellula staleyi]ADB16557.1 hypothetical protein Psta_1883 [Pirellula staleyi DSM 6068]
MQSGLGMTWIWPGLSRLWTRGEWAGLVLAVAFATSLNLALVATFVWPELLSRQISPIVTITAAWVLVVGFWIVGWMDFRNQRAKLPVQQTPAEIATATDRLRQAQREYLRGQYALAEQTIRSALTPKTPDVELALMLVAILRRTGRRAEGLRWIDKLIGMPGAARWVAEIEHEQKQLHALTDDSQPPTGELASHGLRPEENSPLVEQQNQPASSPPRSKAA